MNATLLVTILYLVAVLAVGFVSSRKKGGAHEFFLAGRQLSWFLLIPLLVAEYISQTATVGVAEKLHKTGIAGLAYYITQPLGLWMLAFVFAKFFQRIKKVTVGETVDLLFGRKTRIVSVIILLLLYPLTTCTASLALATTVGPLFGLSYEPACWVSAAFIVFLAILGLRGQAWMNVIHLGVMVACFLPLAIASVISVGGLGNLFASLPAGHLNLAADGFGTMSAWMISAILIQLIALAPITGIFAARSEMDAKLGVLGMGICLPLITVLSAFVGLAAYIVAPGIQSIQALWFMSEHLGDWATMLASIGVLAAIVSTTPAMLLMLGTLATRDIFMLFKPNADDRAQIICCRLATVFIGFAGTALALVLVKHTTIMGLAWKSVGVRTVITIPLFVSILWRRVHPTTAFLTILLGGMAGAIWTFTLSPFGVEPMWPALGVGCLTLVVVSLVKKPLPLKGAEGLVKATEPAGDGE